jgi:transcriptional regulator with GAF, ATPase, and Fis domain
LFDAYSPVLVELVLAASDAGRFPILAIHCGSAAKKSCGEAESWRLLEVGAADILDGSDVKRTAGDIVARIAKWNQIDDALASSSLTAHCVGTSPAWQRILHRVAEGALFSTAPLLLTGESGTGKELIARLVHEHDRRSEKKDLVVVDCTTLVKELSGSELFGHVRGAFTGAHSDRLGAFALADGGTLFLDEIGELSMALQAELLRVVQEGTYKAVGTNTWKRTRFRLIAATHRDLLRDVAEGRFRHDLYHRIAGWCLELPPLRDRVDDIEALANFFMAEFAGCGNVPTLSPEVIHFLNAHRFHGNVRQLRNIIQRAMVRYAGTGPITLGLIAPEDRPKTAEADSAGWLLDLEKAVQRALATGISLNELARQAKECAVRIALRNADGNLQRAARRLGVTDRTLQMRAASKRGDAEA